VSARAPIPKLKIPRPGEPYVLEPVPEGSYPDMVPVLDLAGGFIFWADETLARKLVGLHQVKICRTPKKIRALQAVVSTADLTDSKPCSRAALFGIPHRRETDDNPARVWTQDKMGSSSMRDGDNKRAVWSRNVCKAVVTSCLTKKAA
jgi:hypothetical protein